MKKEINQIPGSEGWWKSSGEDTFNMCAKVMKKSGMKEEDIIEVLTDLFYAASGEHGN